MDERLPIRVVAGDAVQFGERGHGMQALHRGLGV